MNNWKVWVWFVLCCITRVIFITCFYGGIFVMNNWKVWVWFVLCCICWCVVAWYLFWCA